MQILGNRLLIAPLPDETQSRGGIMYAPSYKPEQQCCEVLAVGTGRKLSNGERVPMDIEVGERVLIDQYMIKSKVEAGKTADGRDQFIIEAESVCLAFR